MLGLGRMRAAAGCEVHLGGALRGCIEIGVTTGTNDILRAVAQLLGEDPARLVVTIDDTTYITVEGTPVLDKNGDLAEVTQQHCHQRKKRCGDISGLVTAPCDELSDNEAILFNALLQLDPNCFKTGVFIHILLEIRKISVTVVGGSSKKSTKSKMRAKRGGKSEQDSSDEEEEDDAAAAAAAAAAARPRQQGGPPWAPSSYKRERVSPVHGAVV